MTNAAAQTALTNCLAEASAHIAVMSTNPRVWCEHRSSACAYLDDAERIAGTHKLDTVDIKRVEAEFLAKVPAVA